MRKTKNPDTVDSMQSTGRLAGQVGARPQLFQCEDRACGGRGAPRLVAASDKSAANPQRRGAADMHPRAAEQTLSPSQLGITQHGRSHS